MLLLLWSGGPSDFITDTDILHKPVDFFLAGQGAYKDRYRTKEGAVKEISRRVFARPGGRLSGGKSTFTTRTDKRGYD